MSVVAKFKVDSVTQHVGQATVALSAVTTGPGNESWSKWTPSGSMVMTITNPEASSQFALGTTFLITLEKTP